uniref:Small EDRK-rich factor-like N-terminal domain-containing protein n=1 Tax=Bos indicus x Bos taurus TaxID=30522 RepID=A0A4W2DLS9_BOBOX
MTRLHWGGNQRELARQKNMKKSQEISKGKRKEDSLTTSQRKQRDSEIMQEKQKAANDKKYWSGVPLPSPMLYLIKLF